MVNCRVSKEVSRSGLFLSAPADLICVGRRDYFCLPFFVYKESGVFWFPAVP